MDTCDLLTEQSLLISNSSNEECNVFNIDSVEAPNLQITPYLNTSNSLKTIKCKRKYIWENNPSIRRRQHTRLLRKLCLLIEEYNVRIGQQAVFATCSNDSSNFLKSFRVFGSQPLENIVKSKRNEICKNLYEVSLSDSLLNNKEETLLFDLPSILLNGEPISLNSMTQTHLRCFIPEMLKAATGQCKPGWGKESCRPPWWPQEVPWENIRTDPRNEDQKKILPWTQCLKNIVRCCYSYFNRVDLLLDKECLDPNYGISINFVDESDLIVHNNEATDVNRKKEIRFLLGKEDHLVNSSEFDEVIMCVNSSEELQQLFKDGYLKVDSADLEKIMNHFT